VARWCDRLRPVHCPDRGGVHRLRGGGRPAGLAVETIVAAAFVVLAAAGSTGSAWLLVVGFAGHGVKDLWQHRSHFVANTRWWPPFCMTVDWIAAAVIAVAIVGGVTFHH
jgi:hypothetical protein